MSGGVGRSRRANYFPTDDLPEAASWGFGGYAPAPAGYPSRRGFTIVPRSLSFNTMPSDSGRGGLPASPWPREERTLTLPSGLAGSEAPQARVTRVVVVEEPSPGWSQVAIPEPPSPPRFTGQWGSAGQPRPEEDSRLTLDEQTSTLKKLKKEIYNPTPRRFSRRVSLYYREQSRTGAAELTRNVHDDDDGKRCAICLEDFEPREEVSVTPCNHMFHEDCIVPWIKSHGQCPVCRSVFCDRLRQSQSSYNNINNGRTLLGNNDLQIEEIASMIRLMEDAIRMGRIGHG